MKKFWLKLIWMMFPCSLAARESRAIDLMYRGKPLNIIQLLNE